MKRFLDNDFTRLIHKCPSTKSQLNKYQSKRPARIVVRLEAFTEVVKGIDMALERNRELGLGR